MKRKSVYVRAQKYAHDHNPRWVLSNRHEYIYLDDRAQRHVREYIALAWRKGYEAARREQRDA